jgi:hypothetical protein
MHRNAYLLPVPPPPNSDTYPLKPSRCPSPPSFDHSRFRPQVADASSTTRKPVSQMQGKVSHFVPAYVSNASSHWLLCSKSRLFAWLFAWLFNPSPVLQWLFKASTGSLKLCQFFNRDSLTTCPRHMVSSYLACILDSSLLYMHQLLGLCSSVGQPSSFQEIPR